MLSANPDNANNVTVCYRMLLNRGVRKPECRIGTRNIGLA